MTSLPTPDAPSFVLGWREWVSLPQLNIRKLRAKIDTGARSAALHALTIEPFEHGGKPWVRFSLPVARTDPDKLHWCSAPLLDQRIVTDSGGRAEERYTIASTLCIGTRCWPVAITLTNREQMRYRLLLGRNALPIDAQIFPQNIYLQGQPDYDRQKYPKISMKPTSLKKKTP